MKVSELDRSVMIEIIRSATLIATTEIRTIGSDYKKDTNFFDLALRDVVKGVEQQLLKDTE